MNLISATTALPYRASKPVRTAVRACVMAGALATLLMQSGPSAAPPASSEHMPLLGFTSWYLRINEYLFDGREFKKIIASHHASKAAQPC